MTPQQVELVQSTWKQVFPIQEQAATLFYDKLFQSDPAIKNLFKGNMKEQGKKLMTMINVAVNGLTQLDTIVPALQELGKRHAKYGVKDAHYATVGAALLWTLEQGLGTAFTVEAKQAWVATYGVLASTMQQAAKTA